MGTPDRTAATIARAHAILRRGRSHEMRAVICRAWGEVEDLRVEEVAPPVPDADEVLIAVEATGVNYADSLMVGGRYQTRPPFPFSPGLETAGVVARCGARVTRFEPGDRVMAVLAHGGLAELAVAKESETFAIPDGMPFEEAGAFPIAYISSHVAIRWQGRLEAGETLLVHGADDLIDYAAEKLTERVMALTDGRGADVCFDPVGGELSDAALSSLGWGGRLLLVGFVGGVAHIPANRLLVKNRAALGCSLRYYRWHAPDKLQQSVAELFSWYHAGALKPCVTQCLPLERSVEAIRLLTDRKAYGKVVVVPGL